jgi:hypothetical protein
MKKNYPCYFVLVAALISTSTPSFAGDTRADLIQRIAVSQGLLDIFEQQIALQRDSVKDYAGKLFEQMAESINVQAHQKVRASFERLVAKSSEMFSAAEITAAWSVAYGRDLSVQELRQILKYYDSPIGRKDVAANKGAISTFSVWMNQEAQSRSAVIMDEFLQALEAARQCASPC